MSFFLWCFFLAALEAFQFTRNCLSTSLMSFPSRDSVKEERTFSVTLKLCVMSTRSVFDLLKSFLLFLVLVKKKKQTHPIQLDICTQAPRVSRCVLTTEESGSDLLQGYFTFSEHVTSYGPEDKRCPSHGTDRCQNPG